MCSPPARFKLDPELPKRQLDAVSKLKARQLPNHVTLELPGIRSGCAPTSSFLRKSKGPRTASIFANASGSTLCMIDVAGSFGRDLAAKGEKTWWRSHWSGLTNLFGADNEKSHSAAPTRHALERGAVVLGAFSAASPGGQSRAPAFLMEPLNRNVFRRRAVHETVVGHGRRRLGIGRARRRCGW